MEMSLIVAFGLALGASVASFLNVVADRWPVRESIVSPPSHCPEDGHTLRTYELLPVVSYLVQRGRCRVCRASIPLRVPIVELLGGAVFALVGWRYGLSVEGLLLAVTLSFLLLIAVIDLEHKLVLNKVLVLALPVALISVPFWPEGLRDPVLDLGPRWVALLLDAFVAAAAGFAVFLAFALLSRGGMGGGDVKLVAVIGLWVGLKRLPIALLVAVVLGGIVAALLLLLRVSGRKDVIPFAPFLCMGTAVGLLWGEAVGEWYLDLLTP